MRNKIIGYVSAEDPFRDKKAWSGTKYKIREALQNAGYEVVWISCKPSKICFIFLKILLKMLFGKKAIVEHNRYYFKLCAKHINMNKVRLCDYIFFPGGAQISAFVNFEKPIIYYTDATFHIMIDYYWHGLSSWLITQGEHYEKKRLRMRLLIFVLLNGQQLLLSTITMGVSREIMFLSLEQTLMTRIFACYSL